MQILPLQVFFVSSNRGFGREILSAGNLGPSQGKLNSTHALSDTAFLPCDFKLCKEASRTRWWMFSKSKSFPPLTCTEGIHMLCRKPLFAERFPKRGQTWGAQLRSRWCRLKTPRDICESRLCSKYFQGCDFQREKKNRSGKRRGAMQLSRVPVS